MYRNVTKSMTYLKAIYTILILKQSIHEDSNDRLLFLEKKQWDSFCLCKPVGMENTIRIHSYIVRAVGLREEAEERRKLCSLVYSFDCFVSFLSSNFSGMLHMLKS